MNRSMAGETVDGRDSIVVPEGAGLDNVDIGSKRGPANVVSEGVAGSCAEDSPGVAEMASHAAAMVQRRGLQAFMTIIVLPKVSRSGV
jgi:hypothetical protein